MASCPPLPVGHPRVVALTREEMQQAEFPPVVLSTACWRGYVGTWELRDGALYLSGVAGRYRVVGAEPILADWFSGVIRVPRGDVLRYVHMGFESVYERELFVRIEAGRAVETWTVDNRGAAGGAAPRGWRRLLGLLGSKKT